MNLGGPIALVADDDEFFRVALSTVLLKQFGFSQVVEAGSLDEALERLGDTNDISMALFDLHMPGMQSPANLRAVRECFPSLMVAVVSASRSRHHILQALEAGVHGYIPKGMGVGGLTSALRSLLESVIYVPWFLADVGESAEDSSVPHLTKTASNYGLIDMLTPRQQEVLGLIVQGKSNKEIARTLRLGEGTVKVHMAALFRSLGVKTRSAAAAAGAQALGRG